MRRQRQRQQRQRQQRRRAYLWRAGVQHLANLARNERLAAAGGAVEQHAAHVVNTHGAHHARGKHARRKRAAKDVGEFRIQSADL